MPDSFPPLTALRAFEVASRHLSFSKAAEELFVTPAAISQQIRSLEEHLGVQLFHRHSRSLALTSEAEAGLARLREGFDAIAEAVKQIRGAGKRDTLAVFAAPTFASKWLVPRLHRFSSRYPDINLRIEADTHLVDHRRENMSMSDYLHRHSIDVA
ncbi:MAG: LysR family transcriptional regulator, partial [Candidatus Competibacteraceae bacterium]|nr:LysR family transcriptional regulator [Candidatus Competibacteraceae bacterium]